MLLLHPARQRGGQPTGDDTATLRCYTLRVPSATAAACTDGSQHSAQHTTQQPASPLTASINQTLPAAQTLAEMMAATYFAAFSFTTFGVWPSTASSHFSAFSMMSLPSLSLPTTFSVIVYTCLTV